MSSIFETVSPDLDRNVFVCEDGEVYECCLRELVEEFVPPLKDGRPVYEVGYDTNGDVPEWVVYKNTEGGARKVYAFSCTDTPWTEEEAKQELERILFEEFDRYGPVYYDTYEDAILHESYRREFSPQAGRG